MKDNQQKQTEGTVRQLFADWGQIPKGLCLIRMKHESTGRYCLHIHMKLNDGPWYDQPPVPFGALESAPQDNYREFWQWAAENLPTWDYPDLVKAAV